LLVPPPSFMLVVSQPAKNRAELATAMAKRVLRDMGKYPSKEKQWLRRVSGLAQNASTYATSGHDFNGLQHKALSLANDKSTQPR
jgi:hypothetical protein